MSTNVVIMAAGKGVRMRSKRSKVLHVLAGRHLLQHVLHAVAALGPTRTIVVTGHGADEVEKSAARGAATFVRQEPQLGTGHAVQQAAPHLDDESTTLVLNGDVPLIETATLRRLVDAAATRPAILTVELADPHGYGRIVRAGRDRTANGVSTTADGVPATADGLSTTAGGVPATADGVPATADSLSATMNDALPIRAIVEEKDASAEQRAIREVYTGVLAAPTRDLKRWLAALQNDNAAGEYYLTDVVALAVAEGAHVASVAATAEVEVLGVNSAAQLADLERRYQRVAADRLLAQGVRLADPARIEQRGELVCANDVEIDVGCIFEGHVRLGEGVRVGAYCMLRNAEIAAGATIRPYTHIDGEAAGARVGEGAIVGPYARLRGGARLGDDVHVGNFVEIKNATLAAGAKANHLAYLGDASVGARVNFGAGSITANYDGANKHQTTIGDDAHIGSNCVLVAPVEIGAGATIGAGSTISRDAPAGQLTVARARQASLRGWKRPVKR